MPACAADYRLRRQRILNRIASHRLEAVVLTACCNFAWVSGSGSTTSERPVSSITR